MFVGRRAELEVLRRAATSARAELVPIYGRRRIGKSELILHFLADKPGLYYLGKTAPAALQRAEFCREAARVLEEPLLEGLASRDWKTILETIVERWRRPKVVIALDEFQWMVEASPELPSVLQELWDRRWKREANVFVILCGSFVGFMEREVLGQKSPLFGRRTAQIRLRPFGFREAAELHPGWSREDQARAYFLCGGVALYHRFFEPSRSFEQGVIANIFDEYAPLHREPEFLLREELRDIESYYAVLVAVADGATKLADVTKRSGLAEKSLPYYVQQLVELGYLERRHPLTGRKPARQSVRLRVGDALLRFWFKFVFPNLTYLQQAGGARLWRERVRPELDAYWGDGFESLCREALPRLYEREGVAAVAEIGSYWARDVQIDVVARRDDKWIDLGECKWATVRSLPAIANELEAKVPRYPNPENHTVGRRFFLRKLPAPRTRPDVPNATWHDLSDLYE